MVDRERMQQRATHAMAEDCTDEMAKLMDDAKAYAFDVDMAVTGETDTQ